MEPIDARRAVADDDATGKPDYWDHGTRLELAVLAKDEERAMRAFGDALTSVREKWEPETTARNLRLIRQAREQRGAIEPFEQRSQAQLGLDSLVLWPFWPNLIAEEGNQ